MSLTDPQSHWWSRDSTRRIIAYILMALSLIIAAVSTLNVTATEGSEWPVWIILGMFLPLPLLLGGLFLIAFGTPDEVDSRLIVWPLSGLFIALGAGGVVGGYLSPRGFWWLHFSFAIFAAGGVIAIIVSILLRRRAQRNEALQKRAERSGVSTTGVITRARSYSANYIQVTKITVKFTDLDGNYRWASDTIAGAASTGQRMRVQYVPDQLRHKAAVILSRGLTPGG